MKFLCFISTEQSISFKIGHEGAFHYFPQMGLTYVVAKLTGSKIIVWLFFPANLNTLA